MQIKFSVELPGLEPTDQVAADLIEVLRTQHPDFAWSLRASALPGFVPHRGPVSITLIDGVVNDNQIDEVPAHVQRAVEQVDPDQRICRGDILVLNFPPPPSVQETE